jgi:hypothetical protein
VRQRDSHCNRFHLGIKSLLIFEVVAGQHQGVSKEFDRRSMDQVWLSADAL